MLKLGHIRTLDIHQRRIRLNHLVGNKRPHSKMIVLHPPGRQALQVPSCEHQSPEILVDGFEQGFGGRGCMNETAGSTSVFVPPVTVHAYPVAHVAFPRRAEGFDGEDVAFFHSLGRLRRDEGDLLGAVDAVAEDVVAGDVPDGFDGDGAVV